MNKRVDLLVKNLQDRGEEVAIVTSLADIRWLTGFTGSSAIAVVTPNLVTLVTDGRYRLQAEREVPGGRVEITQHDKLTRAAELAESAASRVVLQEDDLKWSDARMLQSARPLLELTPVKGLVSALRAAKDVAEIDIMTRAQAVATEAFAHIVSYVEVGRSEKEIAAELTADLLRRGAERLSFDPIVASGPNSALPHARPGDRKVESGDILLLDFGCVLEGYCSDVTRVVSAGAPDQFALDLWQTLHEATKHAVGQLAPGVAATAVDAAARAVIAEAGYGEQFPHGLGHGVGLEIHEAPSVSVRSTDVIIEGMVITIEPGIYLEGRFGLRYEDMYVITAAGAERIPGPPSSLINLEST